MVENISQNGHADLSHTLNYLTLPDWPLRLVPVDDGEGQLDVDRFYRYKPLEKVTDIIEAQREACRQNGVAFWDTRNRMGGKGSMRNWVLAGLAQRDYVHFLGQGYRLLGNTLFKDVMRNYEDFVKARESTVETAAGEPSR